MTELTVTAVLPELESCTVWAVELEPTFTLPKVSIPTFVVAEVWSPVPESATVWVPAFVVKVKVPGWEPIVAGENMTFAVQLAPGLTVVQFWVTE